MNFMGNLALLIYFTALIHCIIHFIYSSGAVSYSNSPYGQGVGQILLDDVQCIGTEMSIINCNHTAIGTSNCQHTEDVGVKCQDSK